MSYLLAVRKLFLRITTLSKKSMEADTIFTLMHLTRQESMKKFETFPLLPEKNPQTLSDEILRQAQYTQILSWMMFD